MRQLLLCALFFTTCSGYLDYIFQFDRRFENEQGEVNPIRLARRLYRFVYNNLSMDASNDQAWAQLRSVLYRDYSQHSAQAVDSIFTAMAGVINETFLAYQELYVGNYIDSFTMLMNGSPTRNLSSTTQRGIALFQAAGKIFTEGVIKPFGQTFYNPLNTEMLATLNKSDIGTVKRSFFDLIKCSKNYYNYYSSPDYSNYMTSYGLK